MTATYGSDVAAGIDRAVFDRGGRSARTAVRVAVADGKNLPVGGGGARVEVGVLRRCRLADRQ
jgi:hypothetical protein